jgi:poly(hydroxyalkanoate) depolymerase family esterase
VSASSTKEVARSLNSAGSRRRGGLRRIAASRCLAIEVPVESSSKIVPRCSWILRARLRRLQANHFSNGRMQHPVETLDGTYTDSFGSLKYKLYFSSKLRKHPPLFVMLHGATQSASDFASGTRMHEVVEECGGVTLFPEQSRSAHPQACWNWYDAKHQFAEQGEPAMLAGLTRQVIEDYGIDRSRVYVAGMSAGGAMAVILGQAYPDLYAAVGVHSGLPTGIATDLMSALRVMSSGPPADAESATEHRDDSRRSRPTIVFQGDRDRMVNPLNATAVLAQAHRGCAFETASNERAARSLLQGGRAVTLTRHARHGEQPDAELWMVHGSGHAWAGGSPNGSYTDKSGPNASQEMRRFFLNQSLANRRRQKVA